MSIQKRHVIKLPPIVPRTSATIVHVVQDSIQGWALAIRALLASWFESMPNDENELLEDTLYRGKVVLFDYSMVRPAGSKIGNLHGQAPGSEPLRKSIEACERILSGVCGGKLAPIHVFDLMCHLADCVLAGGIRRSAMLMLFDEDDADMLASKTGQWFVENPQRGRANISVHVGRDRVTEEDMHRILAFAKSFGEPGFVLSNSVTDEVIVNPCAEVGLYPVDDQGQVGFQFCNLTEVNVAETQTPEEFLEAVRCATVIGTFQAWYASFPFLGKTTERIVQSSRLLGVSLTGIMDNPSIGLHAELLRRGAELVVQINNETASRLQIPAAHRLTVVKPSGTASLVLGTGACGIHPSHAYEYIRRIQFSATDPIAKFYERHRPKSIERSLWSSNSIVVSFPVTQPPSARTKLDVDAN